MEHCHGRCLIACILDRAVVIWTVNPGEEILLRLTAPIWNHTIAVLVATEHEDRAAFDLWPSSTKKKKIKKNKLQNHCTRYHFTDVWCLLPLKGQAVCLISLGAQRQASVEQMAGWTGNPLPAPPLNYTKHWSQWASVHISYTINTASCFPGLPP